MPSPADILFNPSTQLAAVVLEELASPAHSLVSIAALHDTTLDALTFWATRPDIQQRIRTNIAFASQRAHWAAVNQIHPAVSALATMLHAYERDERKIPISEDNEGVIIRDRLRSGARRAAWLILRTARSFPDSIPESVLTQDGQAAKHDPATPQVGRSGALSEQPSDAVSGLLSLDAIASNPEAAAHLKALLASLSAPASNGQPVASAASATPRESAPIPVPASGSGSDAVSVSGPDPEVSEANSKTTLSYQPSRPHGRRGDPPSRPAAPITSPPPHVSPLASRRGDLTSPSLSHLTPSSAHLPFPSTSARASLATRTVFDTPSTVPGAPTLAEVADNDRELDPARPFKERCTIPERHLERLKPCQRPPHDIIDSS